MYGLGILGGMLITLKNMFRTPFTIQYPEQEIPRASRFRGEEFSWYEERCTGCASCAKFCPLGIIKIVTTPGGINMQEGESYSVDTFDIDIGRCMFCGLCVEACPYDALFMGSGFERSKYRRSSLVIPIEELKSSEKRPSTWFRPQLEAKEYNPQKDQDLSWDEVGR
ncbi:MAG: NADH-quinone oxidoreductase subunit I [Dehalococcoidia bacterium]|nr:NADH-quinone oxidoreductase subunit I [Dehalococcoidia bacterium]|tara:strand:- start:112 stop:612 length:501 start_codon:yes stop_codon:yes gene_type:complete